MLYEAVEGSTRTVCFWTLPPPSWIGNEDHGPSVDCLSVTASCAFVSRLSYHFRPSIDSDQYFSPRVLSRFPPHLLVAPISFQSPFLPSPVTKLPPRNAQAPRHLSHPSTPSSFKCRMRQSGQPRVGRRIPNFGGGRAVQSSGRLWRMVQDNERIMVQR